MPVTDTTTNTTSVNDTNNGGKGLTPSPANTLNHNTDGFVDYLDQFGNQLGSGEAIPNTAVYIRRWSIDPLPTNPNNTIVIQVLVTRETNRGTADQNGSTERLKDEARVMSVKTRKAQ